MKQQLQRLGDGLERRLDKYLRIPYAHCQFGDIRILDSLQSIQYIVTSKCSVSRFGDGEFVMMLGGGYEDYQGADENLARRLKDVLVATDAPNHIVGLPLPLKHTSGLRVCSRDFWDYFTLRKGKMILPYLSKERQYVDTQLSRFYIMYKDKTRCAEQLRLLRNIWEGKDVVIVEGTKSRTGIGNDLYSNT